MTRRPDGPARIAVTYSWTEPQRGAPYLITRRAPTFDAPDIEWRCTCAAGANDVVCKHLKSVFRMGNEARRAGGDLSRVAIDERIAFTDYGRIIVLRGEPTEATGTRIEHIERRGLLP